CARETVVEGYFDVW
nr:immunoglobulin heavy chain junction region [Mus musculus]